MEVQAAVAEPRPFLSRFRINSSHFTVDLRTPLCQFWGDVIVCFEQKTGGLGGLYEGLSPSGTTYGAENQLEGLVGPRCKMMLYVTQDLEATVDNLFISIAEMDFMRVILTEPRSLAQPQLFVSMLVEAGLSFLENKKKAEIIYSTNNNQLYEHTFSILSGKKKVTFDEGNGIINDDALLSSLQRNFRCQFCSHLCHIIKITQCCRRIRCDPCSKSQPFCNVCGIPANMMDAPVIQKILSATEVLCRCNSLMQWKDYERHVHSCPKVTSACSVCSVQLPGNELLLHLTKAHGKELLEKYAMVISHKEAVRYQNYVQQMIAPPMVQAAKKTWDCPKCKNTNQIECPQCIRCQTGRR